jgi:putative transposase
MMKKRTLPTIRRISDDLWLDIAPLLGGEKKLGMRGRQPVPFRKVLDCVLYLLRTRCQWKALPKEYGSGSTAHRRLQQ